MDKTTLKKIYIITTFITIISFFILLIISIGTGPIDNDRFGMVLMVPISTIVFLMPMIIFEFVLYRLIKYILYTKKGDISIVRIILNTIICLIVGSVIVFDIIICVTFS